MSIVEQLYFTFVSFRVQMGNRLRAEPNEPLARLMREKEYLDEEIDHFSGSKDKQSLQARSRALELVVERSRVEERIRLHLRTPGVRGK